MTQTAVKERGILFSTDMVKAILEGRKTQTRRVIKDPRRGRIINPPSSDSMGGIYSIADRGAELRLAKGRKPNYPCPYGQAGDRLWVKETWRIESFMEGEPLLFGYKDGQRIEENEYSDTLTYESWYERIVLQSTEDAKKAFSKGIIRQDDDGYTYRWKIGKSPCRWRSPRFMPHWASRINLEITEVRAERLQGIGQVGIRKEGIELAIMQPNELWTTHIMENWGRFANLWDSLNAKRGYGWETNPWVWVIGFTNTMEIIASSNGVDKRV